MAASLQAERHKRCSSASRDAQVGRSPRPPPSNFLPAGALSPSRIRGPIRTEPVWGRRMSALSSNSKNEVRLLQSRRGLATALSAVESGQRLVREVARQGRRAAALWQGCRATARLRPRVQLSLEVLLADKRSEDGRRQLFRTPTAIPLAFPAADKFQCRGDTSAAAGKTANRIDRPTGGTRRMPHPSCPAGQDSSRGGRQFPMTLDLRRLPGGSKRPLWRNIRTRRTSLRECAISWHCRTEIGRGGLVARCRSGVSTYCATG